MRPPLFTLDSRRNQTRKSAHSVLPHFIFHGTGYGHVISILFPLLLIPTYEASDGGAIIFYATTAGVLSGSVAGDHCSPISDTTVLNALASDCQLLAHVVTQAPYVFVVVLISTILGTIPIGYSDWHNIIGILLGSLVTVAFVYGICVPIMSPAGHYDISTELRLKFRGKRDEVAELDQLREDTKRYMLGALPSNENSNEIEWESDDTVGKVHEKGVEEALAVEDAEAPIAVSEHSLDC